MSGKSQNKKKQNSSQNNKRSMLFPVAAVVVVIIAIICVAVPKLTKSSEKPSVTEQNQIAVPKAESIVIDKNEISENASYFASDINGTTVELLAVRASDGSVRLALNTCQVCKGSPYAYFEQQGNSFICQNCKNAFDTDSIGQVHGGCNPVPITESDYTLDGGKITVSSEFLQQYAPYFANWKKF